MAKKISTGAMPVAAPNMSAGGGATSGSGMSALTKKPAMGNAMNTGHPAQIDPLMGVSVPQPQNKAPQPAKIMTAAKPPKSATPKIAMKTSKPTTKATKASFTPIKPKSPPKGL